MIPEKQNNDCVEKCKLENVNLNGDSGDETTGRTVLSVGVDREQSSTGTRNKEKAEKKSFVSVRSVVFEDAQQKEAIDSQFNYSKCCKIKVVAQLVLSSLASSFLFGLSVAALNTCKSYIILDFQWCGSKGTVNELLGCPKAKTYGTLINGGVFVGAAIGAFVGGRILAYGRRFALMTTCLIFAFGGLLSMTAEGFASLLIGRIIVGTAVGLSSVVVGVWVSECTPKTSRGFWGVQIQLAITIGILTSNLIGLALGNLNLDSVNFYPSHFQRFWWRFMLGIGIIPAIIGFLLIRYVYKYDTPHYLVEKGMNNTAKNMIKAIYEKDDVEQEFEEVQEAIAEMKALEKQSLGIREALKIPVYKKVLIISCLLSMGQQLTGINVIISNSNQLYKTAGLDSNYMTIMSVILTLVNMLMTFPPIFLIDKVGRRKLLIFGTAGQSLCLLPGLIVSWIKPSPFIIGCISIVSTYGYIICFAISYGPILWVYLFEIFPAEVKKAASGLSVACNWFGAIIMVLPSDYYLNDDPSLVFTLFTGMCSIICVFIVIFTKETKGRAIDDSPFFIKKRSLVGSAEV